MSGITAKGTRLQYATPSQQLTIRFLAGATGFSGVDDPEFTKVLHRIAKVENVSQLTPHKAYKVIEILKGRI